MPNYLSNWAKADCYIQLAVMLEEFVPSWQLTEIISSTQLIICSMTSKRWIFLYIQLYFEILRKNRMGKGSSCNFQGKQVLESAASEVWCDTDLPTKIHANIKSHDWSISIQ